MRPSALKFPIARLVFVLGASGLCAAPLMWETTTIERTAAPDDLDVVADFAFRNASNRPVTISSAETSCACTMVELAQKLYAPGERGKLRVRLEIGDLAGRVEQSVSVVTDVPGAPPTPLRLIANISEFLRVQPKTVRWKVGGEAIEQIVTCTAVSGQTVRLTAAESNDPAMAVRLETVEPGRTYRLHLTPRSTTGYVAAAVALSGDVAGLGPRTFHAYAAIGGR